MKVIGTDGSSGCIVYMSKDELANIAGFYSSYNIERDRSISMAGATLEVSKLYKDATEVLSLYGDLKKDIQSGLNRLNKLADMLNPKTPPPDQKK